MILLEMISVKFVSSLNQQEGIEFGDAELGRVIQRDQRPDETGVW